MAKPSTKKESGKAAPVKVKVARSAKTTAAKKKISHPIPKSWPVSSRLSYPPPSSTSNNDIGGDDFDSSLAEQYTSLKPGKTLQQNCNGCDVFLRKSAVQSTSASIIPTKKNSNSKGAVKRFLIVFPGRMTLKAPPPVVAAPKDDTAKEEKDNAVADNDKIDDKTTAKDNNNEVTKPTKRNPFAPTNPPQVLGRLVSLGGAEQKVELRIPFPSSNNSNNTEENGSSDTRQKTHQEQQQSQMIMSGRAIPLSGKFMALSFKRTGGKDSASAASTPKNKKMGTGSITCKDIFRSVIVLGESKLLDKDGKKVDVAACNDEVKSCHYGGSERTVDGGGTNEANTFSAAKARSVTAPTPRKQNHDEEDESSAADSTASDDSGEDDDVIEMKDGNSDDEFVPTSSKKKRRESSNKKSKSDSDEDAPVVVRKRTPRRSAAKAAKIKYVDADSDIDMSDDDSESNGDDESGNSPTVTQDVDDNSDDDDNDDDVDEIVQKKKRVAGPASKKRKLSSGSSRSTQADDSSLIVIDSDEDEVKTPKQPSKRTNGSKATAGSKGVASKSNAKTEQKSPSSPSKSFSPHRRKKVSPKKPSPKKAMSLDIDDDPFAFL